MKNVIKFLILSSFLINEDLLAQDLSTFATIENDNHLLLTIQIENKSQNNIVFYRPTTDDFCNGIVSLNFIGASNQGFDFPCEFLNQIDHKQLKCDDFIYLLKKEVIILKYSLKVSETIIRNINKYRIQLNYSDTEFLYDRSNGVLYNGILKSDGCIMR